MAIKFAPKFVQAKHYTKAFRTRIDWIVIHATGGPETPRRSDATAAMFARGEREASAHYVVDPAQVVQCVRETDIAWGAQGGNRYGVHVELCGRADQTRDQWQDEASAAELRLAATLIADIASRHAIPVRMLTAPDFAANERGIIGHSTIVKATGKGCHTDPGPGFPWADFIEMIDGEMEMLEAVG